MIPLPTKQTVCFLPILSPPHLHGNVDQSFNAKRFAILLCLVLWLFTVFSSFFYFIPSFFRPVIRLFLCKQVKRITWLYYMQRHYPCQGFFLYLRTYFVFPDFDAGCPQHPAADFRGACKSRRRRTLLASCNDPKDFRYYC